VKWPLAGQVFTTGASYIQNLAEVIGDGSNLVKGGEHSADGSTTPIGHFWHYFNTAAGEDFNVLYNENSTTFAAKYGIEGYNVSEGRNSKADFYDSGAETAHANRVGNLMFRYCQDFEGNVLFSDTDDLASPKNLSGEYFEEDLLIGIDGSPLTRGWTTDNSKSGANTGGGNYRPTSSSAAFGRVLAARQAFPIDIDGNARAANDDGAAGALEAA
jgi:hypothetical protein